MYEVRQREKKFIPRPWRLPTILQSEDASEKLGLFLKVVTALSYAPFPYYTYTYFTHNPTPPLNPDPP
jgi:hypothetical protein